MSESFGLSPFRITSTAITWTKIGAYKTSTTYRSYVAGPNLSKYGMIWLKAYYNTADTYGYSYDMVVCQSTDFVNSGNYSYFYGSEEKLPAGTTEWLLFVKNDTFASGYTHVTIGAGTAYCLMPSGYLIKNNQSNASVTFTFYGLTLPE